MAAALGLVIFYAIDILPKHTMTLDDGKGRRKYSASVSDSPTPFYIMLFLARQLAFAQFEHIH